MGEFDRRKLSCIDVDVYNGFSFSGFVGGTLDSPSILKPRHKRTHLKCPLMKFGLSAKHSDQGFRLRVAPSLKRRGGTVLI